MKLSQFDFELPKEKIALYPSKNRDECKLMVVHRKSGKIEHKIFRDVLNYFDDGDVFIFQIFDDPTIGLKMIYGGYMIQFAKK